MPDVPVLNDPHVYKILDSDIYKWIEAVAYESTRVPLPTDVYDTAHDIIKLIETAQDDSGYIHSWTQVHQSEEPMRNWREGHETYCGGHLIQAGVAWHRATGDEHLLRVAIRFADYLIRTGQERLPELLPLHPGLEMSLVELFRETGDRSYLELAMDYLDRRGHNSFGFWKFAPDHFVDDVPLREMTTIHGHAVMALFLLCGMVDAAVETGDSDLLAAAEAQWDDMVSRKLYITGGAGSRQHDEAFGEPFELSPDTAYSETCAAVGSIMLSWRLLLATGQARYAELIERTLYNAVLPGISLDGSSYFYVNPLQMRLPNRILTPDGYGHRKPWYECACCPPNAMRLISTAHQLAATTTAEGVQIQQFFPTTIDATAGRRLNVETDVPFGDGLTTITVETSDESEWSLSIRAPKWASDISVESSWGDEVASTADASGYIVVHRQWKAGDALSIRTASELRYVSAAERVDAYRGQRAIMRGPIVYCIEEPGLPAGVDIDTVRLTLDLKVNASGAVPELDGTIASTLALISVDTPLPKSDGLYESPSTKRAPVTAVFDGQLIPYFAWGNRGPAKMRIWLPLQETDTQ